MPDSPRLIEVAFPLKQASLDSVHEKNVRHGHISTLHIWPARRPLAACRAALIATLLPDPGNDAERKKLLEKLGGTVVKVSKKKKLPSGKVEDKIIEETLGGVLHWGRESGPDLEFFKQKIKEAYGGQAPKVLDPFAGGGAIPLEAMRLGCEVTAVDINPVAWFLLKCTLEYPHKLAGQHRPLPDFALNSPEFMEGFFKNTGTLTKKQMERNLQAVQQQLFPPPDVDLAWHVRAWGWWVLEQARIALERFYPTVDGKPTVAYLWARTVACKNCRGIVPLLKTRWLCKKDKKRVLLTMELRPDKLGVSFGVQTDVPVVGGNSAQRREHDKKIGAGTMSKSGAQCPCCGAFMTKKDIGLEGLSGRLGTTPTAVVVDGPKGKEYRLPEERESVAAASAEQEVSRVFAKIPFGRPDEPTPKGGSGASRAFSVDSYGLDKWSKLFTSRQLLALGEFVLVIRDAQKQIGDEGYPEEWIQPVVAYLTAALDRMMDRMSSNATWDNTRDGISHVFHRFALPIIWDFGEASPFSEGGGGFDQQIDWVARFLEHAARIKSEPTPSVLNGSATSETLFGGLDLVVTDPPYYDAIPYSDLMDFFYVWLRRTLHGLSPELDAAFSEPLGPKWDHAKGDGELIDDSSRFGGDKNASKKAYEDGMYQAFVACHEALKPKGRMVVVFANKQPDAWEALVSAIIRAGFTVDGSWPIQTEMGNRTRAQTSAALASSVWLVCRKRSETAKIGWDATVLASMQEKIHGKLREFWNAGIRGPDFVWAATGPALEAYSQHPVVKKANEPDQMLSVGEFLRAVRRLVVDFVMGRVLTDDGEETVTGLDDITTYYLLHRNDFGMADAPIGPCILYALSCGLSDSALADAYDILARTGGKASEDEEAEPAPEEEGEEIEEGTGSTVRLKAWNQRKRPGMGYDPAVDSPRGRRARMEPPLFPEAAPELPKAREIPLIDMIHRLMLLWKAGDVVKVDEYLDLRGLRRNELFKQLLQALIELAQPLSEERSILESLSNHIQARGQKVEKGALPYTDPDTGGPQEGEE